jgi:hypothetical protein
VEWPTIDVDGMLIISWTVRECTLMTRTGRPRAGNAKPGRRVTPRRRGANAPALQKQLQSRLGTLLVAASFTGACAGGARASARVDKPTHAGTSNTGTVLCAQSSQRSARRTLAGENVTTTTMSYLVLEVRVHLRDHQRRYGSGARAPGVHQYRVTIDWSLSPIPHTQISADRSPCRLHCNTDLAGPCAPRLNVLTE